MAGLWAAVFVLIPTQATFAPAASAPAARVVDTIVVCPDALREALEPWVMLREAQGHQIAFARHSASAEQVRRGIRRLAEGQNVRWILLVGDAPQAHVSRAPTAAQVTGTFYQQPRVTSRFGPDREIASDNGYADLDDDGIPDVAIGRLTADSPRDLSIMVRKIIAFETRSLGNLARHKVHLIAGVGGFGAVVDTAIESIAKKLITEEIPPAYATTMTYGSWRSPFCPDPRRFHDVTIERLNEGGLFWVYMGHGQRSSLDQVTVPGGRYHILDVNDMPKLACHDRSPIAVFLACYTAAFDAERDCLAEEMLRADGGPVAVIGGSRMTMPYGMAVMSSAMMHECFRERRETIGEIMLHAKRSMAQEISDESDPRFAQRKLLDAVAALLTLNTDTSLLQDERRDHIELFHILGDPLLRLREPMPVELQINAQVSAGADLPVTIRSPLLGNCTIELVCRRDASKFPLPRRAAYDASETALEQFHAAYRLANDRSWQSTAVELLGKEMETTIPIPADARGPCVLRAHVTGPSGEGLGATALFIVPSAAETRHTPAALPIHVMPD